MERLIERCAGLDVHKASVTATVRVPGEQGGRRAETRTFRATTVGLVLLGDWLASFGIIVQNHPHQPVFEECSDTVVRSHDSRGEFGLLLDVSRQLRRGDGRIVRRKGLKVCRHVCNNGVPLGRR